MAGRLEALWFLALVCGVVVSQDVSQLETHLSHLTQVRHPGVPHNTREAARSYIMDQMSQYGLTLHHHTFNTTIVTNSIPQTIQGQNIIGISEGSGGADDTLIVVGADYDTGLGRHPLEDNGAGVAVMLEAARNYMDAIDPTGDFTAKGTMIFVAFDLNTREYGGSAGQPGSYHFLHRWLWPYLNQDSSKLKGVFILDSISRFNHEARSQYLPPGFEETFPEAYEHISGEEMKGNFLAAFTRNSTTSHHLVEALNSNYLKERKARLVRLEELILRNGARINTDVLSMFNHQAHLPFWTFNPTGKPTPLPAILITDTDVYRKPIDSEVCTDPCSADKFLTRRRRVAMTISTSALTHTLLNLQASRRSHGGTGNTGSSGGDTDFSSVASLLPTLTTTTLMVTLARLLI